MKSYPEIEPSEFKRQYIVTQLRIIGTIFNEILVLFQICNSSLRDDGALSLVINFSAALIISTFDDIFADHGNIFKIKKKVAAIDNFNDKFNAFFEEKKEIRLKSTSDFLHTNVRKDISINHNGILNILWTENMKGNKVIPKYFNLLLLHRLIIIAATIILVVTDY